MNIEFTKVDVERRLVFGWGYEAILPDGTIKIDKQGDFIDEPHELEDAAYAFVDDERRGDAMHVKKNVATMIESMVITPEKRELLYIPDGVLPKLAWWTGWRVHDDETWELVKTGKLRGFSVGGTGLRIAVEEVK